MITLDEAKSLKPGDKVYSLHYVTGSVATVEWTVAPFSGEWPDPRIVQYLTSRSGFPSFMFSDMLRNFYTDLTQGE